MDNVNGKTRQSHYTATLKIKLLNILLIIFENTIPVADEDLQIRGNEGRGAQSGLKIRGAGPLGTSLDPPLNST